MVLPDDRRIARAGEIPAISSHRGRHQAYFTGSGGALAIDANWQPFRPDDGKIYPRRVAVPIHQSLRPAPVALRGML
jgi:hypothetical protein